MLTFSLKLIPLLISQSVSHSLLHMSVSDSASPSLRISLCRRVAALVFAVSVLLSLPHSSLVNTDVRSQIIKQLPKKTSLGLFYALMARRQ